jgi:hypothetical protein
MKVYARKIGHVHIRVSWLFVNEKTRIATCAKKIS